MVLELLLELYWSLCRAVYFFARKNGVPFELWPVEWHHLKPEFLKVNPLGKAPALRDGERQTESCVAMLLYLSCKYQTEARWYPPELQACTRLPATKSLLLHFSWQPVDATQLEQPLGKLMPALQHLDQEVLAAKPFLATEQVSLADLMALTELMRVSCNLFRDWPWLVAWQAYVEATMGPKLVQEAHRLVLQPRDPQEVQRDPQLAQKLVFWALSMVFCVP
uniref:GST N-terminal domain-containing protein n=1 Tax=Catagonus wagneri TaxID=51154 RepID=A0A8C3VZP6_9CETA